MIYFHTVFYSLTKKLYSEHSKSLNNEKGDIIYSNILTHESSKIDNLK